MSTFKAWLAHTEGIVIIAPFCSAQAGLLEGGSPGGESPGLPSGRPNVNHQQLESMLSMHGLRDMASDDWSIASKLAVRSKFNSFSVLYGCQIAHSTALAAWNLCVRAETKEITIESANLLKHNQSSKLYQIALLITSIYARLVGPICIWYHCCLLWAGSSFLRALKVLGRHWHTCWFSLCSTIHSPPRSFSEFLWLSLHIPLSSVWLYQLA